MTNALNHHVISGRIGGYLEVKGMELHNTPFLNRFDSGAVLLLLSVGSSFNRKIDGVWTKQTIWRKLEVWGNDASFLSEYSQVGQFITLSYEEFPASWVNKDGVKQYGTKLRVTGFDLPKMNTSDHTIESEYDYDPIDVPVVAQPQEPAAQPVAQPAAQPQPKATAKKGKAVTPVTPEVTEDDLADIPY